MLHAWYSEKWNLDEVYEAISCLCRAFKDLEILECLQRAYVLLMNSGSLSHDDKETSMVINIALGLVSTIVSNDEKGKFCAISELFYSLGIKPRAIAFLKRVVEIDSGDNVLLSWLGRLYVETGRYREAAKCYEKARQIVREREAGRA